MLPCPGGHMRTDTHTVYSPTTALDSLSCQLLLGQLPGSGTLGAPAPSLLWTKATTHPWVQPNTAQP